ncbi:MAG: tetratricopeptide repeat protein [candidate division Zixibacteria bacterium]|nr:tetratricopeptide repeat protein [candidate division Zixibacteria bacterium]
MFVGLKNLSNRLVRTLVPAALALVFLTGVVSAAVPDDAKKEYNRGIELTKAKKIDSAIVAYEAALKIAPDYVDAQINVGALYYEKGDMAKATEHLKKAIELDSNNVSALKPLGQVYFKAKDYDGTINALKRYTALNANDAAAWSLLGQSYKKKADEKNALDAFTKAVTADPKDYRTFYHIGNTHREAKRLSDAITAYRKAIAINPNYVEAYYNLAITSQLADMEKCVPDYKAFIKVATGKREWKSQVVQADSMVDKITKYLEAKGN